METNKKVLIKYILKMRNKSNLKFHCKQFYLSTLLVPNIQNNFIIYYFELSLILMIENHLIFLQF